MDWLVEKWHWLMDEKVLLSWIVGLSVVTMIVSFIAIPLIIRRMPHDYFLENSTRADELRESHPVLRILFRIAKNLLGGILVIGGIIFLVTPGQGILTLLIGIMLLDFPGKRRFEIAVIRWKPMKRAIDWMRKKANKRPLALPEDTA